MILAVLLIVLLAAAPVFLAGVERLRLPQPKTKRLTVELVWNNWLGWRMYKANWGGLTTWLPFCNVISYWGMPPTPTIRVHEFKHVEQRDRDFCFLVTWVRYLWALRHGYLKNSMELEAYATGPLPLPDWAKPSNSAS